jgi:hypothetical protein
MRNGHMTDDDWSRLARKMGEISSAPLFIDDSANLTMMEIRAKSRRLKQRHDLKLIVVDYLQLLSSGKKVESRQLEVSEFSRQIKLLAKELDVPIVAISQLNRGAEQRTDKRPLLSDLRESGSLEQDADMVILLHREDAYEKESTRPGEGDLIVAKHRAGPTGHDRGGVPGALLAFRGHAAQLTAQDTQPAPAAPSRGCSTAPWNSSVGSGDNQRSGFRVSWVTVASLRPCLIAATEVGGVDKTQPFATCAQRDSSCSPRCRRARRGGRGRRRSEVDAGLTDPAAIRDRCGR